MTGLIDERLASLDDKLNRVLGILGVERTPDDEPGRTWLTVPEAAEIVRRAPFTLTGWARHGQIPARKRPNIRGGDRFWIFDREDVEKARRDGPAARGTYRNDNA